VLTLEHILPLSKGGDYSADNLLTACHKCNQGKADTELTPAELKMFKSPGLLFANWPLVGWKAVTI
jgi:5-methylcytosine-specific restriction endonuclease McrA